MSWREEAKHEGAVQQAGVPVVAVKTEELGAGV
jgi:hypothetical protein